MRKGSRHFLNPLQAKAARRRDISSYMLTTPALLWLIVFFLIPYLIVLIYSFLTPDLYDVKFQFTLDAYRQITDGTYLRPFLLAFRLACLTTAFCLLLGFPVAYYIARAREKVRNTLLVPEGLRIFWASPHRSMLGRALREHKVPRPSITSPPGAGMRATMPPSAVISISVPISLRRCRTTFPVAPDFSIQAVLEGAEVAVGPEELSARPWGEPGHDLCLGCPVSPDVPGQDLIALHQGDLHPPVPDIVPVLNPQIELLLAGVLRPPEGGPYLLGEIRIPGRPYRHGAGGAVG